MAQGFENRAADSIRFARAEGHDAYWAYRDSFFELLPSAPAAVRDADRSGAYLVGDAAALPFGGDSFGLVVSYNSLIDVEDMPAAIAEASRVLRPSGCFCACVPHPFSDAGEFTSDDPDAAFVVEGSYLQEGDYELVSERNGIVFHFVSRRFPLESYTRALERAALAIEALREPPLPGVDRHRRTRIPLFLLWRAVRRLETRPSG